MKEFIEYKEALALKDLGFNEPCFNKYYKDENGVGLVGTECTNTSIKSFYKYKNKHCSAPLWQQAFDFFNEKFKLASHVDIFAQTHLGDNYYYQIVNFADVISPETTVQVYGFKTSYDAKLACLKKLIEICKK